MPSILQQSFICLWNIQTVINGYGPSVIAGYAAAVNLIILMITSFTTIGNGISSTAQNLGAESGAHWRGFFAGLNTCGKDVPVPMIVLFLAGRWLLYLFYGSADRYGDAYGHFVFADYIRVLSHCIGEAGAVEYCAAPD